MRDTGPQPEQKSDEEIVEEIYSSKELVETEDENLSAFLLEYGSKKLKVMLEKDTFTVSTYVESMNEENRKERETTLIYKALIKTIKNWVKEGKRRIMYTFTTQDEKLKKWASDPQKGEGIFSWDDISEGRMPDEKINKGRLNFVKIFRPQDEQ